MTVDRRTYLRWVHTADIYTRTTTQNAAGQLTVDFTYDETVPAYIQIPTTQSTGGKLRLTPYQENIQVFELFVPMPHGSLINFDNLVKDVKDRYGNVLEAGPFQIIAIHPKFGWNGKKHHVSCVLKKEVEKRA